MTCSRKKSRFDITPLWWRPWNDLPQEILCLIFESKRLLLPDRVRFRAVCKAWRLPKDEMIINNKSLEYPWLFIIRLSYYVVDDINVSFKFNLVEPHNWKSHIISKSIEKPSYKSPLHPLDTTYATKCGWMLNGNIQHERVLSLFFLNPFSNHHIVLPPLSLPHTGEVAATFTDISTCLDLCEVLVLFCTITPTFTYYIARYKYNRKDEDSWTTQLLHQDQELRSQFCVHYMDGKLYCYFKNLGVLKSYSLADKTWELVSLNLPLGTELLSIQDGLSWFYRAKSGIWLTEIRSSLAMVVGLISGTRFDEEGGPVEEIEWTIFQFDSSEKTWIDVGKDLGSFAFFVCQETIFSVPIEEDDECLIFYNHNSFLYIRNKISCYSLKQKKNIPQPQLDVYPSLKPDFSFRFVEPPFLV